MSVGADSSAAQQGPAETMQQGTVASAQQGSASATQQAPAVPVQQGRATSEQEGLATGQHGAVATGQQGEVAAEAAPEVTGPLAGDPLALALPSFIVGSVALGMVLIGFVSPLGTGASLPIILAATAVGLFISTIWAIALGQSAVALVSGVFAGFWLSYAFLLLGLTNAWFGVGLTDLKRTEELFLTAWVVVIGLLTIATLRLALAFTVVLALVEVALILVLVSVIVVSPNLMRAGGATVFLFAAVGAYIFMGTASIATGGKPLPLGRPVLKG